MPTILALIIEMILLVNLIILTRKLNKKGLRGELNTAISAVALTGILIVITVILKMISGF